MVQVYNVFGVITLFKGSLIINATAIVDGKQITRVCKFEATGQKDSVIPFGAYLEKDKRPLVVLRKISDGSGYNKYVPSRGILEHLNIALELMSKAMRV